MRNIEGTLFRPTLDRLSDEDKPILVFLKESGVNHTTVYVDEVFFSTDHRVLGTIGEVKRYFEARGYVQ